MPRRPWPVLCLGNSVRVFDEATASLARIDDEGAAVCCVEEEDAARGVVGRRDPTIFSQTVHKSTTKAQPCVEEEDAARVVVGRLVPTIIFQTVHQCFE